MATKERAMRRPMRPGPSRMLAGVALMVLAAALLAGPPAADALDVGDRAPGFTLPSTTGTDISLSDFRGKKWVFLEFYAAAFVPT